MTDIEGWVRRGQAFAQGSQTVHMCTVCGEIPVEKSYQRCKTCQDLGLKRPDWFREQLEARDVDISRSN